MSNQAECVAVYDWDQPIDLLAWLNWALDSFTAAGVHPDKILCNDETNKSKIVSLNEISKVAQQSSSPPKDIQMLAIRPGYKQLAFGWRMSIILNMTKGRTALLGCERGMLEPFNVARQMSGIFGPVYGIGFQRSFDKGPDLYAFGMAAGLGYSSVDRNEVNRIGGWMRERLGENRHKHGMLRDIYPLNLLTQSHLLQQVEQMSLHDWIKHTHDRGELIELGNNQWIWQVANPLIERLRCKLRLAGLIIKD